MGFKAHVYGEMSQYFIEEHTSESGPVQIPMATQPWGEGGKNVAPCASISASVKSEKNLRDVNKFKEPMHLKAPTSL